MDMKWRLDILRWVGQKEGTRRMVPWWHFWTFAPAPGRQLPDFLSLFLKYYSCVFCDLQLKVFLVDAGVFTLPLKPWTRSGFSLKRCSRHSSACEKNVSQPPSFLFFGSWTLVFHDKISLCVARAAADPRLPEYGAVASRARVISEQAARATWGAAVGPWWTHSWNCWQWGSA